MSPNQQGPPKSADLTTTKPRSSTDNSGTKVASNTNKNLVYECYSSKFKTHNKQRSISCYLAPPKKLSSITNNTTNTAKDISISSQHNTIKPPAQRYRPTRSCHASSILQNLSIPNKSVTAKSILHPTAPLSHSLSIRNDPHLHRPKYTGPNPYKKQQIPIASPIFRAIEQLRHIDQTSGPSSPPASITSSDRPTGLVNTFIRTRTRIVKPPQRLGFRPTTSLSESHSSLCTPFNPDTLSSEQVPQHNSTTDLPCQEVLLREIEEISLLTQQLTTMMEQTGDTIMILQNQMNIHQGIPLPNIPREIDIIPAVSVPPTQDASMSLHTQPPNSEELTPSLPENPSPSQTDHMLLHTQPETPEQNSHHSSELQSKIVLTEDLVPPENTSLMTPNVDQSTITKTTTSSNSKKNINDIGHNIFDQLLDDVRNKNNGDYRIVLQNTNGIKEFRETDPDYYPTMRALQKAGADHLCLIETNTPWHQNDFLYDISMVHKHIWSTPTKTFGASCRKGKHKASGYQPGGVLSVVANSLTSKIQSTETDSLGRWAKTRFFAKNVPLTNMDELSPRPVGVF